MNQKTIDENGEVKKPWYKSFRFTSIFKPMVYLLLISLLYDAAYVAFLLWENMPDGIMVYLLSAGLVSLYGVGLYFVCTLIWGRKRGTLALKKVLHVWLASLALGLSGSLMSWMVNITRMTGMQWVIVLGAVIGLALILFAIPSLILFFYSIYQESETWKEQFDDVLLFWKHAPMKILNGWLLLFLLMYVWDNLFAGPMMSMNAFSAPEVFTMLIFMSEPGCFAMLMGWLGIASISSELIVLQILQTILLIFLSCNVISWTGRLCQRAANATFLKNRAAEKGKKA